MKTFYLTTPIYYPNARPHVGSAYTTIVCDVIARYKRMCGYDVAFLTGTDEHGEKLQRAAEAAGKSPAEFVASKRELFRELWRFLDISDYRFVHTSQNPEHVRSVQWMLQQADKNGYIEKKKYEGRYCVSDERYVSDNTDPVNCDICGRPAELISEENYFFKLKEFEQRLLELYDGHAGAPGRTPFVQPEYRLNEVKSFVKSGLRDISVSRKRLKWGIPWPDDPNQVFYVWYDALTSYMTGIGFGSQDPARKAEFQKYWRNTGQVSGVRSQVSGEEAGTSPLTPDTSSGQIVHMIGKDILRFHAVYWPAFIMAAFPDQPEMLPTTVFAHGWIYYEQDKMSKSKGNVVYPEPIVAALDFFGAPGNDALRYYLLREATFGQDTSFSYDGLIQRFNSDLANDLGNLAYRTLDMLKRFCGGKVPSPESFLAEQRLAPDQNKALELYRSKLDKLKEKASEAVSLAQHHFENLRFSNGLEAVWELVSEGNTFLSENMPWQIAAELRSGVLLSNPAARDDYLPQISALPQATRFKIRDSVLYAVAEVVRLASIVLSPVLPGSAVALYEQVCGKENAGFQSISDTPKWGGLIPETTLGVPRIIFPRLDKAATLAKLNELAEADYDRDKPKEALKSVETETPKATESPSNTGVPPVQQDTGKMPVLQPPSPQPMAHGPSQITIEDFAKVEMRVGEIISAEPIPKATKLLKIQVDIGTEIRQVLAGIAEHYQPEQLVGMKVVVVTNLQPRKMRGLESNGMIVAASIGETGKPVLVTFKEDVPKGARLK